MPNEIKTAILQPSYIPWKGVFDMINKVDHFVFYDDVQFTKKTWRNRNRIKTNQGPKWLTIPVMTAGLRFQSIVDTQIDVSRDWQRAHYRSILHNYNSAKYFDRYRSVIEEIYVGRTWKNLADLNIYTTQLLAEVLEINVNWVRSSRLNIQGSRHGDRAAKICAELGSSILLNGPTSLQYIDPQILQDHEISLEIMNYDYPKYDQLHGDFVHEVSVVDLLLNCGPDSLDYLTNRSEGQ